MKQNKNTFRADIQAILQQRREARERLDPEARQRRTIVRGIIAGGLAVATAVAAARYDVDFAYMGLSATHQRGSGKLRDRMLPVFKSFRDATGGEKLGARVRSRLVRPALSEAREARTPEITRRQRALALASAVLATSGIYPIQPSHAARESAPVVFADTSATLGHLASNSIDIPAALDMDHGSLAQPALRPKR